MQNHELSRLFSVSADDVANQMSQYCKLVCFMQLDEGRRG
jgi:hypothetical protein